MPRNADAPSSAISNDVFPEPVGPKMRFIRPRLKRTSPSMFRTNFLFCWLPAVAGVEIWLPTLTDQVKEVCLMPITSEDKDAEMGRSRVLMRVK